jgi:hypothetical protein
VGPDGITPLILMKNCASTFACPLYLLFNRFLSTCFFPDSWKLSYVTPIFKKSRRNNVKDYRQVAILSAIPKCFELLVYRTIYDDLKNFNLNKLPSGARKIHYSLTSINVKL